MAPKLDAKQLKPGTNGQSLQTVAGVSVWAAPAAITENPINEVLRAESQSSGLEAGIGGIPDFE